MSQSLLWECPGTLRRPRKYSLVMCPNILRIFALKTSLLMVLFSQSISSNKVGGGSQWVAPVTDYSLLHLFMECNLKKNLLKLHFEDLNRDICFLI